MPTTTGGHIIRTDSNTVAHPTRRALDIDRHELAAGACEMCGMRHATRDTVATSENPTIARLRGIPDPVARAAAAQTFIVNGRQTLRAVERVRDDAIREARRPGNGTIDQLAHQVGARRNVVVTALRNRETTR